VCGAAQRPAAAEHFTKRLKELDAKEENLLDLV
jgi:hypothetical protein